MIPKSGYRFSEKMMLQQLARTGWRFEEKSSRSSRRGGLELQRNAVHAIALAGRRRAVAEHVAEMAAATPAMHLLARDDQAEIVRRAHRVGDRRIKARPPGAE